MLKNFLLIIRRNLARNKAYTFINIAGLALGMAAFILISAYVRYEESYDRMHRDAEHIYRVESRFVLVGSCDRTKQKVFRIDPHHLQDLDKGMLGTA